MKKIILAYGIFIAFSLYVWGANIVRLTKCDFEPSYKAEVIYGLGIFTPTCYATAFIDLEK